MFVEHEITLIGETIQSLTISHRLAETQLRIEIDVSKKESE